MDLKLKVTQGKNVGQEVAVPGGKFLIGRAEDCHLRPGSDMISRHHCVILIEQGYVAVRDFGSRNGTFVNGERVVGECELKAGDRFRVGPLEFEVSISQGALGGKKKPPVHDAKEAAARAAETHVPNEADVDSWLSEPMPAAPRVPAQETQSVRLSDTDEIDVGSTREFDVPSAIQKITPSAAPQPAAAKPSVVPAPKSGQQLAAASTPAAKPAAPKPAPAPQPAPQPVAQTEEAPETVAAPRAVSNDDSTIVKKGMFGGNKKTFGKLPTAPQQGTKDSRSAAEEILNKFRKRR